MKNLIKISLAACLMLVFSGAHAITVNDITFGVGDSLMGGFVVEGTGESDGADLITAVGQELVGINKVTAISNESFVNTWLTGDNGVELWVVFDSYIAEYIEAAPGGFDIGFSGGEATYYVVPEGSVSVLSGFAAAEADILAGQIGDPWLETEGHGIGTCADFGKTCAGGDDTELTLLSKIFGELIEVEAGSGFGFLDVTGGEAALYLDTDQAFDGSDIQLGSDFSKFENGAFAASGTLDFKIFAVPEPGMLSLLGLGLLGMAGMRRRKV